MTAWVTIPAYVRACPRVVVRFAGGRVLVLWPALVA